MRINRTDDNIPALFSFRMQTSRFFPVRFKCRTQFPPFDFARREIRNRTEMTHLERLSSVLNPLLLRFSLKFLSITRIVLLIFLNSLFFQIGIEQISPLSRVQNWPQGRGREGKGWLPTFPSEGSEISARELERISRGSWRDRGGADGESRVARAGDTFARPGTFQMSTERERANGRCHAAGISAHVRGLHLTGSKNQ